MLLFLILQETMLDFKFLRYKPVDTGRKLNIHKTFRRRPGRLLNVLCTFNLRPVSTGKPFVSFIRSVERCLTYLFIHLFSTPWREIFWCFQVVEKRCIGNKWFNRLTLVICVIKSSDITLWILWTHYAHVRKVRNIIFYATKIKSPFTQTTLWMN